MPQPALNQQHEKAILPLKRSAAAHAEDHTSSIAVSAGLNSSIVDTTSIALHFGRADRPFEFSQPHVPHLKRASPTLTFQTAKCNGEKYYKRIRDTYAAANDDPKNNQGAEFGESDINNGWSRTTEAWTDDMRQDWEGAFKHIADETGAQPSADLTKIRLRQDTKFTNKMGNVIEVSSISVYAVATKPPVISITSAIVNSRLITRQA
ncbi:MAG: hypothetical protein Q9218_007453 [Villophora microphyllina]